MRVSSSFNAVTAPLLYRSLRIGDSTAKFDPLYTAPLIDGQSPRKSLDKANCLKMVKELDLVAHGEDDCPHSHFDGPKKVEVLRLSLPLPIKRNTQKPPTTSNHLEYGGQRCPLTASIKAGKIVAFNTAMSQPIHLLDLPQDSLHTLVTAFSYSDIVAKQSRQFRPATKPFKGSIVASKQAIYILWMGHPRSEIKKSFVNLPSSGYGGVGLKYLRFDEIKSMCDPFMQNLVREAMNVDFPNDIVVVNIAGLDAHRRWKHDIRGALDSAESASWEELVEEEIKATQAINSSKSSQVLREVYRRSSKDRYQAYFDANISQGLRLVRCIHRG